jgi:hypothetical protein
MCPTDHHPAYFQVRFRSPGSPLDWPISFAIITAWATTGEFWSAEENQAADAQLAVRLRNIGCWHRRITGYSPLDGHAEAGWAALLPLELARDLGREFRQDAIYWVSGDQCWVTKCAAESELVSAGSFRERLDVGRAEERLDG